MLYKWDFVHANVVYLLRLADDALVPVAPAMRSLNQVQVIGDSLLVHTDLDAPRGRACVAPLRAPTQWRTLIPESSDTLQTVAGVGGRLYAVCSSPSPPCKLRRPSGPFSAARPPSTCCAFQNDVHELSFYCWALDVTPQ